MHIQCRGSTPRHSTTKLMMTTHFAIDSGLSSSIRDNHCGSFELQVAFVVIRDNHCGSYELQVAFLTKNKEKKNNKNKSAVSANVSRVKKGVW